MDAIRDIAAKPEGAKAKLLEAALRLIREKGYTATSVDELCAAAGVTKGAFFHHFENKEALGVAAARHWRETTDALFESGAWHKIDDPLDRVLAYIDFRTELLGGPLEAFTCLAGMMVQEVYATSPAIREACEASIFGHARTLEADFAAAFDKYGVTGVSAAGLAAHTQAVLQGGFILAKAKGGPSIARDSVAHLKRYIELLFNIPQAKEPQQCLK